MANLIKSTDNDTVLQILAEIRERGEREPWPPLVPLPALPRGIFGYVLATSERFRRRQSAGSRGLIRCKTIKAWLRPGN